jgi:predicted nucleotidyltransferase component of viral defense system
MIEPANFAALVDKAMILSGRGHMRPVIEKELLHYDILFSLDKEGLLDILTFQGGTSLRLCYGAPRFSEHLDFAGGRDFAGRQMDVQERTFMKDKFCDYLANEIRGLLDEVRQGMSVNPNTDNQFES